MAAGGRAFMEGGESRGVEGVELLRAVTLGEWGGENEGRRTGIESLRNLVSSLPRGARRFPCGAYGFCRRHGFLFLEII